MSFHSLIRPAPTLPEIDRELKKEVINRIVALGKEHGLELVRKPPLNPAALLAESLLRLRRRRESVLGAHLFADPCWDMLLDLYVALNKGTRPVSVSSLCVAAAVPATTAIRWIETLVKEGLIFRESDPTDKRRVFIHLTDRGIQQMDELLMGEVMPRADGSKSARRPATCPPAPPAAG